jgi:hypothetical protein
MSSRRVHIEQLASAINEELKGYTEGLALSTKEAVKKQGANAAKALRDTSPKRKGRYAKGWRSKIISESTDKVEVTVHNAKWYMLTHLLEHGHARRGGGRVAAKPHIAAVEQAVIEDLERDIERQAQSL